MKKLPVLFLIFLCLQFVYCAVTGPGGKQSVIIIPTAQEVAIGAGMDQEVRSAEKILPDSLWQNYITEIGQRIVAVSDRKDIEYRFTVIESDQINAFAAPGGFIYFYTGLIKEMSNEAELASVVAHELSHVVGRHGVKRLQAALGASLAYQLVFGDENSEIIKTAVGVGMNMAFSKYSKSNEHEADNYGMHYMVKAGYNPNGMVTMFEILAGKSGEKTIFEDLFGSHPDTQDRISNAKDRIKSMQPLEPTLTFGQEKFQMMKARLK